MKKKSKSFIKLRDKMSPKAKKASAKKTSTYLREMQDPEFRKAMKKLEQKDKRLQKTYGITLEEYEIMAQYGCYICNRTEGRLNVDHIHQKGFKKLEPAEKKKYVRGVLCFLCNTALKGFERTADGQRNRSQFNGTIRYFSQFKLKGEL